MTARDHIAPPGLPAAPLAMKRESSLIARWGPGCFKRMVDTCRAAWDTLVPYGYEDETGFHYGVPPTQPCRVK